MKPWQIQCIVLLINGCLVAVSVAFVDGNMVREPAFWAVLLISTMVCGADLSRVSVTISMDRLPTSRWARVLCQLTGIAVFAVWWAAIVFARLNSPLLLCVGIVIAATGAAIRCQAVMSLGNDFVSDVGSERYGESALVTRGIYAYVRHPSELGLALATLGAVITSSSLVSLAIWTCWLMPLSYLRVRLEELSLRDRFGNEYLDYERTVGSYLPRVM